MTSVPNSPKRQAHLRDLRTAVTARIRSKPTIEGQRYLDLYVLQRDRFRWKRLKDQAERSIQSIDVALRKLGFDPDFGSNDQPSPPALEKIRGTGRTIDLGNGIKRRRSA